MVLSLSGRDHGKVQINKEVGRGSGGGRVEDSVDWR